MKISDSGPYVLAMRAAVAMLAGCVVVLAGCSNAAQIAPTPGQANSGMTSDANQIPHVKVDSLTGHPLDSPMSGEVLTGTSVHGWCHKGDKGEIVARGKFNANGTASGPYPGTFTARGRWEVRSGYFPEFSLHESFTISSGTYALSGKMWVENGYTFVGSPCKPAFRDLTYLFKSSGWTGSATAEVSKKSFSETFKT